MTESLTNKTWLDKLRILQSHGLLPVLVWAIRHKIAIDYFGQHPQYCLSYFPRHYKLHRPLTFGELVNGVEASTINNTDLVEGETIACDFATLWIYENVPLYETFAGILSKVCEDFEQISYIDKELSKELIDEALPRFGTTSTFIFVVLMSVLLHQDVLDELVSEVNLEIPKLQFDNESIVELSSPKKKEGDRGRLIQSDGSSRPRAVVSSNLSASDSTVAAGPELSHTKEMRSGPAAMKRAISRITALSPDIINKRHSLQLLIKDSNSPTASLAATPPTLGGSLPRFGISAKDDVLEDQIVPQQQTVPDLELLRGRDLLRKSRGMVVNSSQPSLASREDHYSRFLKRKNLHGYLWKQTRKVHPSNELKYNSKLWKRRWVVLTSDKLMYYKDEDCEEPRGVVPLYMVVTVRTCPRFGPFAFQIDVPGRQIFLKADCESGMQQWLFALQCAFALNLESFSTPAMRTRRQHISLIKKWWKQAANWDYFVIEDSERGASIELPSVESCICRETHSEIVVCAKQGNREYMEDQHIIVPCISLPLPSRSLDEAFTCTLVGVFDGHGGVEAAEYCKLNIARVFSDCISKCAEADMHKVLANTFKCLDEEFLRMARDSENRSGTTATVVSITKSEFHLANVGDSQAVLSRNGVATIISEEHRPGCPTERARILEAGGVVEENREINMVKLYKMNPEILAAGQIPMKLADAVGFITNYRLMGQLSVSRAIGDAEFKGDMKNSYWGPQHNFTADLVTAEPHVVSFPRGDDDEFIVIATDGLWDVLTPQQVVDYIREQMRKGTQPSIIVENLVVKALGNGSQDNITAMVCFLHSATQRARKPPDIQV